MSLSRVVVAGLSLAILACDRSPGAPSRPVGLFIDLTAMTLGRNATAQVSATLSRAGGTPEDVTGVAEWTSGEPAVVTVDRGLIRAVGIGGTWVTAKYLGLAATARVTARRNTRLLGRLALNTRSGGRGIGGAYFYLDGRNIDGLGGSDSCVTDRVFVFDTASGRTFTPGANVDPGTHQFVVKLTMSDWGFPCPARGIVVFSEPSSQYRIADLDTGELLATIPLPAVELVGSGNMPETIMWTIDVPVYAEPTAPAVASSVR